MQFLVTTVCILEHSSGRKDRDFPRFLWVTDNDQKDFELVVKRVTSVMLGFICSPSLLRITVRHHVMKYLDLKEDLVVKFLNYSSMDDSISGSDFSEKCF